MQMARKTLFKFFGNTDPNSFARFCSISCADGLPFPYHRITGKSPGVIYCTGLGTPPWDSEYPLRLQKYVADDLGYGFFRFQYRFAEDNSKIWQVSNWVQDILSVFQFLGETEEPQKRIIVGVSAGGQAVVRAAIAIPEKVHSLLLLSPGLDLNMNYMERIYPGSLAKLEKGEKILHPALPGGFPSLVDYNCLKKDYVQEDPINIYPGRIPVTCPVRILHGMDDFLVPHQNSVKYAERLESDDVEVDILRAKGHLLEDCPEVFDALEKLLKLPNNEHDASRTVEYDGRTYI